MECTLPACFKAYDIRGRVPEELHPQLAYDIGRAFAAVYGVRKVAVGRDIRLSGPELSRALVAGLRGFGGGCPGSRDLRHGGNLPRRLQSGGSRGSTAA